MRRLSLIALANHTIELNCCALDPHTPLRHSVPISLGRGFWAREAAVDQSRSADSQVDTYILHERRTEGKTLCRCLSPAPLRKDPPGPSFWPCVRTTSLCTWLSRVQTKPSTVPQLWTGSLCHTLISKLWICGPRTPSQGSTARFGADFLWYGFVCLGPVWELRCDLFPPEDSAHCCSGRGPHRPRLQSPGAKPELWFLICCFFKKVIFQLKNI